MDVGCRVLRQRTMLDAGVGDSSQMVRGSCPHYISLESLPLSVDFGFCVIAMIAPIDIKWSSCVHCRPLWIVPLLKGDPMSVQREHWHF